MVSKQVLRDMQANAAEPEGTGGKSTKATFTPGPWKVLEVSWHTWVVEANGETVAMLGIDEEASANARLIAAAPELLSACEAAKHLIENYFPTVGGAEITQLEEAIARAKGGQ